MALQNADSTKNGFSSAVRDAWLSSNYQSLYTQRSPFFKMLQMNGAIKPAGYGIVMREPIDVPVLTGPQLEGVSNAYAARSPTPMTGRTTASYPLSEYLIDVSWEDYQDIQAGGDVEMVQWQESIFKSANVRSINKIMDDLWRVPENALSIGDRTSIASIRTFVNAGTTAATDGGASPSAQSGQSATPVVGATGTTAQTLVGNIQRSAAGAAYWCPSMLGASGTSVALTVQILNDLYEEAFQEGEEPDLILCPSNLFGKLQNILTVGGGNGGQFQNGQKAMVGFSTISFRGANIVVDRRCPTAGFYSGGSTAAQAHMYCLNTRHFKLRARSRVPKYKEVPTNMPIQEQVGQWYIALTADHLGNCHSFRVDLTT